MSARALGLALALIGWTAPAAGQSDDVVRAEALFDEAQELRQAGRYDAACPKLRESHELDPALGTLLYLADCYEQIGMTGTAYKTFVEAEEEARGAGDDREDKARRAARALEPRLRRIVVRGGGAVRLDGVELSASERAQPIVVDPGRHSLQADYRHRAPVIRTVEVLEPGKTLVVELPHDAAPEPSVVPSPEPDEPDEGLGAQRIAAISSGALGVVGLVVGTALAIVAKNRYDGAACTEDGLCTSDGLAERDAAIALANGATGGFVVGGALGAVGIVLWFTAPTDDVVGSASLWPSFTLGGL